MSVSEFPITEDATSIDLARECLYRFLSAVVSDPHGEDWNRVLDRQSQRLAIKAADLLREELKAEAERETVTLTFGERGPEFLDLAPLIAELNRPITEVRGDFDRVFGLLIPKECPPYETEYYPPSQDFLRAQQMADIAGFYQAFGLQTSAARPDRPDHLALELEFMAVLLTMKRMALETAEENTQARQQAEVCGEAQVTFARDHLCWWVPAFAAGLKGKACCGYLNELSLVLSALIPAERKRLGIEPPFRAPQPGLIEHPEEQTGCEACPLHA